MATTGIWKIKKRLDHVIEYTTNMEKTLNKSNENEFNDLHNAIEYIESDYKTEKQLYVTGINCSPEIAYQEMIITKKNYSKEDGILGFHAFQSFAEGEVTPEQAHEIGVKLAQEMWGDRFEVLVSTHLNTNHLHNHFVINSVSFKDGKRYYDKRETYAELRRLSDSLCEEYGLSVLAEKTCKNSKINYANYYKGYIEKDNYYTIAKRDIDFAIRQAYSYRDFESILKTMDYEIMYRANKLSIRREPYKKNIRIERYFGNEYSLEKIKERIANEKATRIPFPEEYGIKKYISRKNDKINHKNKGIYALYLYYCYLLKVFPYEKPHQRLPASMRNDVRIMQQISEEIRLLVSNKIETNQQFFLFQEEKQKQLDTLLDKREKLWYQHKKGKTLEEKQIILKSIDNLNKQIAPLRKEINLCSHIEERVPKLERNIQQFEKEIEKGVRSNDNR